MVDIFERLEKNTGGPIGQYMQLVHGYFAFPKLEGELGPHMRFRGKEMQMTRCRYIHRYRHWIPAYVQPL